MKNKFIPLLEKRIEKLEDSDFDLEAWKSATVSTLERIFDSAHSSIKRIDDLKIDYSSWALRDATSKYNPTETCKRKGKEILSSLIDEIELGIEDEGVSVVDILKNHLSEEVIKGLDKKLSKDELVTLLKKEKKGNLVESLAEILRA